MRYVILGGGGSFGLATSKYLLEQPETDLVVGIGRNPPKQECFSLRIGEEDPRYRYRAYHIGYEYEFVVTAIAAAYPDVIINFAAQGEGAASYEHSWRYFDTNCTALVRLTERLSGVHFIHIGSSEVYGTTQRPADEGYPLRPTSPYAVSKAAFDMYLGTLKGFPYTIVRPSNCYGPGQQLHRLIPKAMLFGMTGRKLPLHGGGRAEKSYIHTRDLARAIHALACRKPTGEIFNVGPRQPVSVRRVVEFVAHVLRVPFDKLCEVTEDRAHQDARYWLDSSRMRALGWEPTIGWVDGLLEMKNWIEQYLPQLSKLPTEFEMRA